MPLSRFSALTLGFLAGGFARYVVGTRLYALTGTAFPWGTFAVNLSGCFFIGLFDAWAESRMALGPEARLLLMTGFCGAYTTFSTLILETNGLLLDGQFLRAAANFLGSGVLGLALLRAGMLLGRAI